MVMNPHGIESVKKIPTKQNPSLPKRVLSDPTRKDDM